MRIHERIEPRWRGQSCVIAATGPSLDAEVAELCHEAAGGGYRTIAVNDAHRLLPWADVLYSCDAAWWNYHKGVRQFAGERWSSHALIDRRTGKPHETDNKELAGVEHDLDLVRADMADGFSLDPRRIHYGNNSGFQAMNLALLFGVARIVLVGFNMQPIGDRAHFFGDHPRPIRRNAKYLSYVPFFTIAARGLPPGVTIINATPHSALRCFRFQPLEIALELALALEDA